MKNKKRLLWIALAAVFAFSLAACSGSVGKEINSADALKAYLDSQPANSPDKPIKVTIKGTVSYTGQQKI